MKRKIISAILLFVMMLQISINLHAQSIKEDQYLLKLKDNKVSQIFMYKDEQQEDLIKIYNLDNIEYDQDTKISEYLKKVNNEIEIKNDKLLNKTIYQNSKIIQYIKYDNNINYLDNDTNEKYYHLQYFVNNNKVSKVFQYYVNSNVTSKRYYMYSNTNFAKNKISNYHTIDYLNTNNTLNKKESFNNNNQKSALRYYYSNANLNNQKNKVKQLYYYKNNYVTSLRSFYDNTQVIKSYTSYYAKAKHNNNLNKYAKYVITTNNKQMITSKVKKENQSQRIVLRYYYLSNTKLFNNENKSLKEIKHYALNRGKNVYTGSKYYKNGKRTKVKAQLSNVPYYNQMKEGYRSGCEFFSVRMALAYKGKKVSARKLYKEMNKSMSKPKKKKGKWYWANPDKKFLGDPKKTMLKNANWGINPKGILPLANKYRKSYAKHNFSTNQIREELLKGNAVVVWASYHWNKPFGYFRYIDSNGKKRFTYANFHVMTVTGMDDKYVYMLDPALGKKKVSIKKFDKSYKPYGRKALVIT